MKYFSGKDMTDEHRRYINWLSSSDTPTFFPENAPECFLRYFSETGGGGEPAINIEIKVFALQKTNRNFIYLNGDPNFVPGDAVRYRILPTQTWSVEKPLDQIIKVIIPVGTSVIELQRKDLKTGTWPIESRSITVTYSPTTIIPVSVHDVIKIYNEFLTLGRRYFKGDVWGSNLMYWTFIAAATETFKTGIPASKLIIPEQYPLIDPMIIRLDNFQITNYEEV